MTLVFLLLFRVRVIKTSLLTLFVIDMGVQLFSYKLIDPQHPTHHHYLMKFEAFCPRFQFISGTSTFYGISVDMGASE